MLADTDDNLAIITPSPDPVRTRLQVVQAVEAGKDGEIGGLVKKLQGPL